MDGVPEGALFSFKTAGGTFWIAPELDRGGRFLLRLDGVLLGSYSTPGAAAADVAAHTTTDEWWDLRPPTPTDPAGLGDWTPLSR
ncbi:MAG: hypothetical protein AABZ53_08145 [Planctomycetota bacterium]